VFISLVALSLAYASFMYTRAKDDRARRQSIEDDFWLRKVASPVSIEPFMKFATDLATRLPRNSDSAEAIRTFWTAAVADFGRQEIAFKALGVVRADLSTSATEAMERMEDRLAEYCGDLMKFASDAQEPCPSHHQCAHGLVDDAVACFHELKSVQHSVGHTAPRRWRHRLASLFRRNPS
jgi:hypothetical protein